jgi:hypothetical protein
MTASAHRCSSVVAFACFTACRTVSLGWARHGTNLGEGAASLMVHEAFALTARRSRCSPIAGGTVSLTVHRVLPARFIIATTVCCRPPFPGTHLAAAVAGVRCKRARVCLAKVRPRQVRHGQPVGPFLFHRLNGWREQSLQGPSCGAHRGSVPATRAHHGGGDRTDGRSDRRRHANHKRAVS